MTNGHKTVMVTPRAAQILKLYAASNKTTIVRTIDQLVEQLVPKVTDGFMEAINTLPAAHPSTVQEGAAN